MVAYFCFLPTNKSPTVGKNVQEFVDEDCIVIGDGGDIVSAAAKVIDITLPGQWLAPRSSGMLGCRCAICHRSPTPLSR
jgi:thiamine pyrophosphate-dependent acetolactate synthase large subunit-like protein